MVMHRGNYEHISSGLCTNFHERFKALLKSALDFIDEITQNGIYKSHRPPIVLLRKNILMKARFLHNSLLKQLILPRILFCWLQFLFAHPKQLDFKGKNLNL